MKKFREVSGIIKCSECNNEFQIELIKEPNPGEWNMLTTCPFCGIRLDYCCGFNQIEIMEIPISEPTKVPNRSVKRIRNVSHD